MDTNSIVKNPQLEDAVPTNDLPEEIQKQINILTELESKKNNAQTLATNAKNSADNMKSYVTKKFLGHEYKSGDTKEIITDMQEVMKQMSLAQESQAEATTLSFEFIQALSKTSEYLFALGCFNFAATETMIAELTSYGKQLTGHEGLSDTIKQKMREVAKRLNMQKDLMLRQSKLEENQRNQARTLDLYQEDVEKKYDNLKREMDKKLFDLKNTTDTSIQTHKSLIEKELNHISIYKIVTYFSVAVAVGAIILAIVL